VSLPASHRAAGKAGELAQIFADLAAPLVAHFGCEQHIRARYLGGVDYLGGCHVLARIAGELV
jgi:hypothetical protein